jgi:uncharacterized protein
MTSMSINSGSSSTTTAIAFIASSIAIVASFQLLRSPVNKLISTCSLQWKANKKRSSHNQDGTVSGLFIHPVKSLRAVSLTSVEIDSKGFVGDRRLMIVYPLPLPEWKDAFDANDTTHRFLSQRQCPSLARVVARLEGNFVSLSYASQSLSVSLQPTTTSHGTGKTSFRASIWDDHVLVDDLGDQAAAFFQAIVDADENVSNTTSGGSEGGTRFKGVRLVLHAVHDRTASAEWTPEVARSWLGATPPLVSLTDGFPLLIACEASLEELNRRLKDNNKEPVDINRFRANIIIKGTKPFEEDYWKYISIGDQIFAIVKPCPRCKQSCTDQVTGKVHAEPLEIMKTFRALNVDNKSDVYFAQNAIPLGRSGSVAVGDAVHILERGEPRFDS